MIIRFTTVKMSIRGAGIIPYTFHDNKLKFLFQKYLTKTKSRDRKWKDFGGSSEPNEDPLMTAVREFVEETNAIFYIVSHATIYPELYKIVTSKVWIRGIGEWSLPDNKFDPYIEEIKKIIPIAIDYYYELLYSSTIYSFIERSYATFFLYVPYTNRISPFEDLHINYLLRYKRRHKWVVLKELLFLDINGRLNKTRLLETIVKNPLINCCTNRYYPTIEGNIYIPYCNMYFRIV